MAPGRRGRAGLGWPSPTPDGQGVGVSIRYRAALAEPARRAISFARCVNVLSALLRQPFSDRGFRRADLRRSQCADVALRDGTRVEGPRGFGMDTPGPLGPALPPLLLNTRAKNLFDLKTRGSEEF